MKNKHKKTKYIAFVLAGSVLTAGLTVLFWQNGLVRLLQTTTIGTTISTGTYTSSGSLAIKPGANATNAIQLQNASGTNILNIDTTNSRVGIGTAAPAKPLDVAGDIQTSTCTRELNWSMRSPPVGLSLYDVSCGDASTCFTIDTTGTVSKTTNGGVSWNFAGSPYNNSGSYNLFFADANTGWAVPVSGANTIKKTADGGINWSTQTSAAPGTSQLKKVHFYNSNSGWIAYLDATDSFNAKFIYTADGGDNWTAATTHGGLGVAVTVYDFASIDANTVYAVTGGGGIVKTTDGGDNWTAQTSGTSTNIYQIHCSSASACVAVGEVGLIKRTIDGGSTWSSTSSPTSEHFVGVHFSDANTGWILSRRGDIYKTTDGATTWTQVMNSSGLMINDFNPIASELQFIASGRAYLTGQNDDSAVRFLLPDAPQGLCSD